MMLDVPDVIDVQFQPAERKPRETGWRVHIHTAHILFQFSETEFAIIEDLIAAIESIDYRLFKGRPRYCAKKLVIQPVFVPALERRFGGLQI